MSTVDLVLLGYLLEKPQSAYDINKQLEFRNLGHWVKLGRATVYKNLLALQKKGYLTGVQQQQGNMPPKTLYEITDAGRAAFGRLMVELAGTPPAVHFDFNAVVANLNKIPYADALARIEDIRAGLAAQGRFIREMQPQRAQVPLVGRTIMRQQVLVLEALLAWLDEFETEFRREHKTKEA